MNYLSFKEFVNKYGLKNDNKIVVYEFPIRASQIYFFKKMLIIIFLKINVFFTTNC